MEVNDYYTKIKPSLRQFTPDDVIKASAIPPRTGFGPLLLKLLRVSIRLRSALKWPCFFSLFSLVALETAFLRLITRPTRGERSAIHQRASELVAGFASQYPLWPYSILIKALHQAFVERQLPRHTDGPTRVLELAIGEGSFSSRIFSSNGDRIVALDINPVSLSKAAALPHVSRAIVANCLRPPISSGSFSVLLANNFLHHVSDKAGVLARWAAIAPTVVFNESTPLWSESWPVPRLLRFLRLRKSARFAADLLNRLGSQDLLSEPELTRVVSTHIDIREARTYFDENTYLFATLPCAVALNMGAVPEELKQIALRRPFRRMTTRLTVALARLLIQYDEGRDRQRDVFVSYAGASRHCSMVSFPPQFLCCPSCGEGHLNDANKCGTCGRQYNTTDGMLFVLEPDLAHIEHSYDPVQAAAFAREHL
jgi:hypothetical protein